MKFSEILNLEFNSPLARKVLSLYYKPNRYYKIPFGALKGFEIWYDRTINYHAVLGVWEKNNFSVMEKLFNHFRSTKKPMVIFDIGANIGLFTLFFNRYTDNASIVAFEAVEETTEALKTNLNRNNVTNVTIKVCAVSDQDGEVTFFVGHHHKSSLLKDWASDHGATQTAETRVPAIRIDTYSASPDGHAPDFIKIDVEGAADRVLAGARDTFRNKRPIVMIESHNPVEDKAISQVLIAFGYDAYRINDRKWVRNKQGNYQDRNGVWGTMILLPNERRKEFTEIFGNPID